MNYTEKQICTNTLLIEIISKYMICGSLNPIFNVTSNLFVLYYLTLCTYGHEESSYLLSKLLTNSRITGETLLSFQIQNSKDGTFPYHILLP